MIDDEDVTRDMVPFAPGDHDQRVARGDWVFYVRAVKRGSWLNRSIFHGTDPVAFIVLLPFVGLWALAQRRARWKVGVVRVPSPSGWKTDRARVLHREVLAAGASPGSAVAALVVEVRDGRFNAA